MTEYETAFMEVETERDVTRWHREFTEYWTASVAVDADPNDPVEYSLRVVGPNGEVCKNTRMNPEDTPREVRAKFEDMLRDGAKVV